MKKIKVVSAKAMTKIEGLAFAAGHSELQFMERAGVSIANAAEQLVRAQRLVEKIFLLVGKGNNGGDAYAAGVELLDRGFQVIAFHVYSIDLCGPLCRHQQERFANKGGEIRFVHEGSDLVLEGGGLVLDGLVGTGFRGKAEGVLADVICVANRSELPILSIDIPSGVCGNTGRVETVAIQATSTVYLELPKVGFFLEDGWNHVGHLIPGEFGLPSSFLKEVEPEAFLVEVEREDLLSFFPPVKRTRHKYETGYVGMVAGSSSMPGAGMLASHAALRSGCGLVRWFHPPGIEASLAGSVWEVIKEPMIEEERFWQEMKRMDALLIGPGMGRDEKKKLKKVLSSCHIPSVLDADALFFLAEFPAFSIPSQALLTPHHGEMKRLLEAHGLECGKDVLLETQKFVEKKQTTVLLKGAPNFLFSPQEIPQIFPVGNPGMAKAGSGDVLAGILVALLAQGLPPSLAGLLGTYLHGKAGDYAALKKTEFCLMASDLIEELPLVFSHLVKPC